MVSYFGKLTRETITSPFLNVRVHFRPDKTGRDKLLGSPNAWVRERVKQHTTNVGGTTGHGLPAETSHMML